MNKTLSQKITSDISINITSTLDDNDLDEPIFAINWFNTKRAWLYDFYNLLAVGSVKKVNGKLFFKGKITDIIQGSIEDDRQVLLVVNYPSPTQFLKLLTSKYFLFISILRKMSVKDFTFCFTRPVHPAHYESISKTGTYAVHHFRSADAQKILESLGELSKNAPGINSVYSGLTSSKLSSQKKDGSEEVVPCLMDGIIIYKTDSVEKIEELFKTSDYQKTIGDMESSFTAVVKRIK